MKKGYKIRRYGRARRRELNRKRAKTALVLLSVLAAALAGWFLYEPFTAWVKDLREPRTEPPGTRIPADVPPEPPGAAGDFPGRTEPVGPAVLADEAALRRRCRELVSDGADGALLPLKDRDGQVLYASGVPWARENPFRRTAGYDLAAAVRTVREEGLVPVGRLFAFEDGALPRFQRAAAVKYDHTDTNWLDDAPDAGGKPWLNPASPDAREYLLSLIRETASLGLEEILLDGMRFPEGYSLELATYGPPGVSVRKSGILADFCAAAKAAGAEAGCRVTPVLPLPVLDGRASVPFGDDPEKILRASGRVAVSVGPDLTTRGAVADALGRASLLRGSGLEAVAAVRGRTAPGDGRIRALTEAGIGRVVVFPEP